TRPATGTKPLPPHGTTARYQGNRTGTRPPCKCRPCLDAHRRACNERELAHLSGILCRVPIQPIANHIHNLLAVGMSHTQIGLAAGVSRSTVIHIARGKHPTCNRESAERVLAVRPRIVRDTDRVPAVGTRRRLQALYALGHGSAVLSSITGLTKGTIQNLLYERAQDTTAATYKTVRAVYRQLAATPGSSSRARASARAGGWVPPAAWDDDIDSPAARPVVGDDSASRNGLGEIRREEIAHLASYGMADEIIAARLGLSVSHVRNVLRELRAGERRDRGAVA
ncbi:hypothetical protein, partial [Streptomyces sp. NPDC056049]|uniref:hypothetical protein n=1 Tax=Streptomyces sp. NPDC056049 TaxID=3345693 RepID=UPI0035E13469